MDDLEGSLADPVSVGSMDPDLSDLHSVIESVINADPAWVPGTADSFGQVRWRPDLERADSPAVLHVHLAERLRPYVLDRLTAASEAGREIHLALPLSTLYDEGLLKSVHELDPQVHLIRSETFDTAQPDALLTVLCDQQIQVSPAARTLLATKGLELSQLDASAHVKGRRYEAVIAFLLSQVSDFTVVERDLRTDTEELDAVIQQRATQGRVWSGLGAPLILVEAKNWAKPVPQKEASAFRVKIDGRRRVIRLGLMFGASGFTSDALDQELRFASHEITIAFVNPDDLLNWIEADDGDDFLEKLVRRAMLR